MKLLIFATLIASSWSWTPHPVKTDLEEMDPFRDGRVFSNVHTKWMEMTLDHFNPLDNRKFLMRYMTNEEHFGGDDHPIFIFVGGEWSISEGWLIMGNMYKMAEENHGYIVYTEHRYYGRTQPFANTQPDDFRYLSADQAMADLAVFINTLKQEKRFANSKVILYGPSYAGNLALWFKQRYPHLALGAIASGSPIKAEMEFAGYLEMVEWALLSEGGHACVDNIRNGIREITAALETPAGREQIYTVFNLCESINETNVYDLGAFSGMITWSFSNVVQRATPGALNTLCDFFLSTSEQTPMQLIAGFLNTWFPLPPNGCRDSTYEAILNVYRTDINFRSWIYQTCTEFGYFQIAPTSGTIFDPFVNLDVDFYINPCQVLYSENFTAEFLSESVDRVNLRFGGLNPVVENTINIHGEIDPWRALGVYDRDLGKTSPTYNIPRASHTFDVMPWLPSDTIRMTNAQQRLRRTVTRWLTQENK